MAHQGNSPFSVSATAGTITNIPLSGDNAKTAITPKGYVAPPGQSLHGHYSYGVNGDYFSALGIPLRGLRWLTRREHQFHDTELSGAVEHACHALAIDEQTYGPDHPSVAIRRSKLATLLQDLKDA